MWALFFVSLYPREAEKAMATHSSTLAWKIPWTEEPGGLQSTGSLGVGHDWATLLSLFLFSSIGFPGGSDGKASAYNAGDLGLISGSGRTSGEGNDNPLQYSCLENVCHYICFFFLWKYSFISPVEFLRTQFSSFSWFKENTCLILFSTVCFL